MDHTIHADNRPRLDVVIPGAQKAGTTSLLDALGAHPQVVRHETREFGALLDPEADLEEAVARWLGGQPGLRLAKSAGFMYASGGFERLHSHNPDARLIFMLREPVSRMYSAYWFARRTGHEPLDTFEAALLAEGNRTDVPADAPHVAYRARSDYLTPLREATALFGRDQVRVVVLEDYGTRRLQVLTDLQRWLGLEAAELDHTPEVSNPAALARSDRLASFTRSRGPLARSARRILPRSVARRAKRVLTRVNEQTQALPAMDPVLDARLRQSFAEHNAALTSEFQLDLSAWDHDG